MEIRWNVLFGTLLGQPNNQTIQSVFAGYTTEQFPDAVEYLSEA
jgi:hypothetical protein